MRRRGWIVLLSIVVILLGAVVVVDRVAAGVAGRKIATKLGQHAPFVGTPTPHVTIRGFPFLTQAVSGKYSDIEVSASGLTIDSVSGLAFDAHLHGVHVAASDALNGNVEQLPVDRIAGDVTVPYTQVATASGGTVQLGHQGDQLLVSGQVSVPGVGTVTGRGTGKLEVSSGQVKAVISSATVNGRSLPSSVLDQVAKLLTPQLKLPRLPYDLRLTGVRASDDGVVVSGEVSGVVLISRTGS